MSSLEYLAAIAANTAATNESVQEAIDVLEEIRERLPSKPNGPAGSPPTRSKRAGTAPNYYGWQFGRFGDTSAKKYVNSGR